jgi:PAS domain S-box-containing protein
VAGRSRTVAGPVADEPARSRSPSRARSAALAYNEAMPRPRPRRGPGTGSPAPLSEALVREVLDGAPDALVVVDAHGRIVFVNTQTEVLFGYARDALIGQTVEMLLPEHFRAAHQAHRSAYAAEPRVRPMGVGLQLLGRRKDGSEFPVEISLSPTQSASGPMVIATVRDVTERVTLMAELRSHRDRLGELVEARTAELSSANLQLRREVSERTTAEGRLREQANLLARERQEILALNLSLEARERFIRGVIESLRDGIAVLDLERRVVSGNPALEVHSGIPIAEIVGRPFFEAFPAFRQDGLEPILDRLYDGAEDGFVLERRAHVSRAGGPMTVNLKGSVIRGPRGPIEGVVVHIENVTERLRLEQSAQEAEKLAAIGTLAAGLAHEINNPIGIMTARIELMLEDAEETGLAPAVREDLAVLQRNAHRVGRITQGLLSFARKGSGVKRPTDLSAVAAETLLLFETHATKAGLAVQRRLADHLPRVLADANQLQQVVLNLLNNAREALGTRGEIRVETGIPADRPGWVSLAVSDNGPGIPADVKAKIFLPFFTTKAGGTGLGLAVSYRIVKDHGGMLEVSSEPGRGTTFTILLPTEPQPDA